MFRDRLINDPETEKALGQCLLLERRSPDQGKVSDHVRLTSRLLIKILQRGKIPLPTIGVEREALRAHGLLQKVDDLSDEGAEVGWQAPSGSRLRVAPEDILAAYVAKVPFDLDQELASEDGSSEPLFDSEIESQFLNQWVPEELGETAGHWFTPQASLGDLLGTRDDQRVDFLFHYPGSKPVVIEIDGPEHDAAREVDRSRDKQLKSRGIEVCRVPNEEINRGKGKNLSRIRERCQQAFDRIPTKKKKSNIVSSIIDCTVATKIQFAIARALRQGRLKPDEDWGIEIAGAGEVAVAGVLDVLKLLSSLDVLYGGQSAPERCTVKANGESDSSWVLEDGEWKVADVTEEPSQFLRIEADFQSSPFHSSAQDGQPDFVIRPAFLPVNLAVDHAASGLARRAISQPDYEKSREALTVFLQNIFRKLKFNDMQGEAVHNVLCQNDSIVLLPTGAGKSLIYQLAGLLMPGVTLGVYPLVALIEDQYEGLYGYGIDRALPIARSISTAREYKALLSQDDYQFILVTPERMQTSGFREALQSLVGSSLINLAVVDEAHCVSEWGHDFRPAYLNLANNLREFCEDNKGESPPILALTGTASRTVLYDTLTELGIDKNKSNALIRPRSFDRPELNFEIVRTRSAGSPAAVLEGVLRALPDKMNLHLEEFYRPQGRRTNSGIVFVPTVRDKLFGILGALRIVKKATRLKEAEIAIYSGMAPPGYERGWDEEKRRNARRFKQNEASVLVATNAFGMGIDKPNIRYTAHFGMPPSLENFYQEAGRAGRDRKPAYCIVVFTEYDPDRSADLLDSDLASLRAKHGRLNREDADDVTRALWFHLQAFAGMSQEIDDIKKILDDMDEALHDVDDFSARREISLPFWGDSRERQEKAIYRLLRIGFLNDYKTEYGSRRFDLDVRRFDLDYCKNRLLRYMSSAQVAMSRKYADRMDEMEAAGPKSAVLTLAQLLIEFTYEVIEGSRRRMIQEAMRLARRANSDEEIRNGLLYYLQEGLDSESIKELLQAPVVVLSKWLELADKIQTPIEAGELRGICIRELESYPTHPGLLLTRAIAESLCSDYDANVCKEGLRTGIFQSLEYKVEEPLGEVIEKICHFAREHPLARERESEPGLALTLALFDLIDNFPSFPLQVSDIFPDLNGLEDEYVDIWMSDCKEREVLALCETAVNLLDGKGTTTDTEED